MLKGRAAPSCIPCGENDTGEEEGQRERRGGLRSAASLHGDMLCSVHVHVHVCTQVWSTRGVEGVHRFLARAYRVFEGGVTDEEPTKEQMRLLHATIKKVRLVLLWAAT